MIPHLYFMAMLIAVVALPVDAFLGPGGASSLTRSSLHTSSSEIHLFNFLNEGKKALVKKLAGDYDADVIQARLDSLVKTNPVLMLSFTTCPFCVKAKEVLDAKGAKYTVLELDQDTDGKAIRAELGEMVGRTSVPAIWIGQKFVGGCNDGPGIITLDNQGELDKMLKGVKAI